jgi:hypothetical protein
VSRTSAPSIAERYLAAPRDRVLTVNPERRIWHRGNTYRETEGIGMPCSNAATDPWQPLRHRRGE